MEPKIRRLSILVFGVIILMIITSCDKNRDSLNENINHIERVSDIVAEYHEEDLLCIRFMLNPYSNYKDLHEGELLRIINDDVFYTAYKSKEGGLLFVLFEKDESSTFISTDWWYVKEPVNASLFASFEIGKRSVDDVKAADIHGNYISFSLGMVMNDLSSSHYCYDGKVITINYSYETGLITSISVSDEVFPLFKVLWTEDLDAINAVLGTEL